MLQRSVFLQDLFATLLTRVTGAFSLIVLSCVLIAAPAAWAENDFGVVELVEGKVSVIDAKGQTRLVHVNDKIIEGETIMTGRDGQLHVLTEDHGYMAFRPNSKVLVERYRAKADKDDGVIMSLAYGAMRSITGWIGKYNANSYTIRTPSATIGIRGTDHEPLHIPIPGPGEKAVGGEPGTYEKVNSGSTSLKNPAGEVIINSGQFAYVSHDPKKAPKTVERAPEAYRWTMNEAKIEARKEELTKDLEQHRAEKQKASAAKEEAEKKSPSTKKKHKPPVATK